MSDLERSAVVTANAIVVLGEGVNWEVGSADPEMFVQLIRAAQAEALESTADHLGAVLEAKRGITKPASWLRGEIHAYDDVVGWLRAKAKELRDGRTT